MSNRYICLHGHFYQPPRENPWLEAIEIQDSAHPYRDWNERISAECYHPNTASRILDGEGRIIDRLEQARKEDVYGVALNAGAYTHTSLALADCLAWIGLPCVEVHLSNILARAESIRHASLIAPHCVGVISGFGLLSYALAVQTLWLRWSTSIAEQP